MGHRGATTNHGGIAHLGAASIRRGDSSKERQGRIWLAIFSSVRFLPGPPRRPLLSSSSPRRPDFPPSLVCVSPTRTLLSDHPSTKILSLRKKLKWKD